MAGKGGKSEAACPMCGSILAKSPAGQAHMAMLAEVGKRMTPRPGVSQGQPMPRPHPGGYTQPMKRVPGR